jgi:hypothetical protein
MWENLLADRASAVKNDQPTGREGHVPFRFCDVPGIIPGSVWNQSSLPCEGRPPEVSAWKGAAGPVRESAPADVLFPACSPAAVQVSQRALPMLAGVR